MRRLVEIVHGALSDGSPRRHVAAEHAGRVAIVTGASSGIGRATAMKLAAAGARVLAVARSAEQLAALAAESPAITPLAMSIETPAGCLAVVAAARQLGPPLILVNSAGLGGYLDRPIFEQSQRSWRATMAVNLDAPFELSRHVAHDIRKAGFGRIVMISSTAARSARRRCRPIARRNMASSA